MTRLYASQDTSEIKESFGVSLTAFEIFQEKQGCEHVHRLPQVAMSKCRSANRELLLDKRLIFVLAEQFRVLMGSLRSFDAIFGISIFPTTSKSPRPTAFRRRSPRFCIYNPFKLISVDKSNSGHPLFLVKHFLFYTNDQIKTID